jgi:hypothetical protein
MEWESQVGSYGMPTPLSLGSTGSIDASPQPVTKDKGLPITFARGWGHNDQENIPPMCPGSAVRGLVLIKEDGGEINQGIQRVMEDNQVKLML